MKVETKIFLRKAIMITVIIIELIILALEIYFDFIKPTPAIQEWFGEDITYRILFFISIILIMIAVLCFLWRILTRVFSLKSANDINDIKTKSTAQHINLNDKICKNCIYYDANVAFPGGQCCYWGAIEEKMFRVRETSTCDMFSKRITPIDQNFKK